jgi:hypothetical protein
MQVEELWNDMELTEDEVAALFSALKAYVSNYTRGW